MKHVCWLSLCLLAVSLNSQTPCNAEALVDSLIQVSRSFTDAQDFTKALEPATVAAQIALEQCGSTSAAYGSACFNRGRVYYFQGAYTEAEPWYLLSKTIREKALGAAHPDYGKSVNNLAILYDVMGRYEKAEPLYLEVIALREKTPGKESAAFASALSNLAGLYMQMGQYEKAEKLSLETLAIREKVLGKQHPDYASSLQNLANLYYELHNFEKAEPLYLESQAIREAAGDRESADYFYGLDNLGVLYQAMGQYKRAEVLLLESKNLREKTVGGTNPDFALSLNHLANLYRLMRDYSSAETYFLQSQSIGEQMLGREHPNNIINLESLAVLYSEIGQHEKAVPLLLECHALYAKILGKEHPYYASNLDFLGAAYWASGDMLRAESAFLESARLKRQLLENAARHLSERELASYIRDFTKGLAVNCSFAGRQPELTATCYDDVLFYKGFLLNAASQLQKLASSNPADAEKYNLLKSCRRRLAVEYAKPLSERKDATALETEADQIEKDLTSSVAGYGDAVRQFTWHDVQAKLRPDEAALEFVHFRRSNPQPTDSTMYAALLLLPGTPPQLLTLFEEKQLAALLATTGPRKSDFVDRLYATADRGAADSPESLYELLWKPIQKEIPAAVKTVYFSPSGLLHCVNLAAVELPEGEMLADRYNLIQLGSTRQICLQPKTTPNAALQGETALIFGGIRYDIDSVGMAGAEAPTTELRDESGDALRGGAWNYLKGTEKEANVLERTMIVAGLHPQVRRGYAASEEAFKIPAPPSPLVLHFATHGFFYPDPENNRQKTKGNEPIFQTSAQPMMRSGLILAGGNYAWQNGKPFRPDMEDGVLTAYEIAQMDLSHTELVVLSACETGLGDIRGNEGVYGLQRAFKIAGARYLVMSLWRVPDLQTQELMTDFYRKWLLQNMTIPDAFRAAQKDMRDKYGHPFFWAGFVLVE
jgi:CHAT domain-containing protein/Flp pilus assembly protein TadD